MLFVPLDTNWPDHPKVIAVGLDGAGLHAAAMCIAKRLETDGVLHRAQLHRLGANDELIDRLVSHRLFDAVDDDRVRVHDWLDRNPSQGAIAADRTAKRASAMRGNHKRWGHPGEVEDCGICNPRNGTSVQVVADCDRTGLVPESHPESGAIARDIVIDRDRARASGDSPSDKPELSTAPPPPHCPKHPPGAPWEPCGACAQARRTHEAWKAQQPPPKPSNVAELEQTAAAQQQRYERDMARHEESMSSYTSPAPEAVKVAIASARHRRTQEAS